MLPKRRAFVHPTVPCKLLTQILSPLKTFKSMKRTVKFSMFIFGLALFANLASAQEIYWQDEKPCATIADTERVSQDLPEGYLTICTDPNQIKYIRVAIHFLLPGKIVKMDVKDCDGPQTVFKYIGLGNFTETGDGFTNSGYNGYRRAEDIINQANAELDDNADQWRKATDPLVQNPPLNITYPTTPPEVKVRYLLMGVYFHRDESAYYANFNNISATFTKYGIETLNTVNVFYTPNGDWSGVANTNSGGGVKYVFNNDYLAYVKPGCRNWSLTYSGSLLNHEIGHTLSLAHTWPGNDNCNDTPEGFVYDKWYQDDNGVWHCQANQHANCWMHDDSIPTCPSSTGGRPCDTPLPDKLWYKISNNMMDYNVYAPHAVTECQIARINADLAGAGNMFVHSCNGCMPSIAFFQVPDVYHVCPIPLPSGGGFYLNGVASFNENKWLIDICEVDPAAPDICLGNNINTGWNTGEIGKVNLLNFYTFQLNKHYRIKLIVDNTDCPLSSEYTKIIEVQDCYEPLSPTVDFAVTNPFSENINVFYTVSEPGRLQIRLVDINTGNTTELLPESDVAEGEYQLVQECGGLNAGAYSVQVIFDNNLSTKTIIKP